MGHRKTVAHSRAPEVGCATPRTSADERSGVLTMDLKDRARRLAEAGTQKAQEAAKAGAQKAQEVVSQHAGPYSRLRALLQMRDDERITPEALLLRIVEAVRGDEAEEHLPSDVEAAATRRQRLAGLVKTFGGPLGPLAGQVFGLYCEAAIFCDVERLHRLGLANQQVASHLLVFWNLAPDYETATTAFEGKQGAMINVMGAKARDALLDKPVDELRMRDVVPVLWRAREVVGAVGPKGHDPKRRDILLPGKRVQAAIAAAERQYGIEQVKTGRFARLAGRVRHKPDDVSTATEHPPAADPEELLGPEDRGEPESLGQRLGRLGNVEGAISAHGGATDAGEEPLELRAVLRYAEQLERRGEHEAANAAFKQAAECPEPDVKAAAWRGIASYLFAHGQVDDGLAALEVIVDTGDPEESPRALRNIGTFKEDALGDLDGARAAYEAAIASDHPLHSQGARVNLAQLLDRQGDRATAAQLFRQVIGSGHPVEVNRARVLLGLMLDDQGDETHAVECFEAAMAEADTEWGQRAAFNAGGVYLRRDELDDAARAFAIAERTVDRREAAMAAFLHGKVEKGRGNEQAALEAYERAIRVDGLEDASARQARLASAKEAGVIFFKREDLTTARELFAVATGTDDGEQRARASCLLAMCERQLGNRAAAVTAFEAVLSMPGAPQEVLDLAHRSLMELS